MILYKRDQIGYYKCFKTTQKKVFNEEKPMKVRCPRCGKKVDWETNPFRPFCSERCKLIDLGRWFDSNYVIPGQSINGEKNDKEEKDP